MKLFIMLLVVIFAFSTEKRDLKRLKNFGEISKIKSSEFYILWEIPVENDGNNRFSLYNYDSEKMSLENYRTVQNSTILAIGFKDGEIVSSASISEDKYFYDDDVEGYWLGTVPVDISYQFITEALDKYKKKAALYPLLISHKKDTETLKFLSNEYSGANFEQKKKIVFWFGQIDRDEAVEILMKKYNDESDTEFRKKVIFALYCNETDLAKSNLIAIAKDGGETELRKKAIFWLGQKAAKHIKHFFKDMIYNDDEIKIKEAAIFALYNMKDSESLREVVEHAKDYRLRKKALFWMGQLKDIDIDYFENILNIKN
jgi:hypothetical protein